MNIFLLLLSCTEILAVLLFIPGCTSDNGYTQKVTTSTSLPKSQVAFNITESSPPDVSSSMSNESPTADSQFSSSREFSPSPSPKSTTTTTTTTKTTTITTTTGSPNVMFYIKECRLVYIVSAGLIIACTILLISTLILACRTCQLSRRLKTLSSNCDLNFEYGMETASKNKSKSETEAKETSVLMSDLSQTQEEMSNGTTKEDGGGVKEDGQKGEENEADDAGHSEEAAAAAAPVTVAENSSSSKPQEEAGNSQSAEAAAPSSSEGTEAPKDVL